MFTPLQTWGVGMISYAQLSLGSLVKLGFFANLAIWTIFSSLAGLGGLTGLPLVKAGGVQVYGVTALVTALLIGVMFTLAGTVLFTVGAVLVRLLGDRAPKLELRTGPTA